MSWLMRPIDASRTVSRSKQWIEAIINPKSNVTISGFNTRAVMLMFRKECLGTFHQILHLCDSVKERLFVHEDAARWGHARPPEDDTVGGAAIHDYLLQHSLCLRLRHGGGSPAAMGRLRTTVRGQPLTTDRRATRT